MQTVQTGTNRCVLCVLARLDGSNDRKFDCIESKYVFKSLYSQSSRSLEENVISPPPESRDMTTPVVNEEKNFPLISNTRGCAVLCHVPLSLTRVIYEHAILQ